MNVTLRVGNKTFTSHNDAKLHAQCVANATRQAQKVEQHETGSGCGGSYSRWKTLQTINPVE